MVGCRQHGHTLNNNNNNNNNNHRNNNHNNNNNDIRNQCSLRLGPYIQYDSLTQIQLEVRISLGIVANCANSLGFRDSMH